jgi:hypothetical protein
MNSSAPLVPTEAVPALIERGEEVADTLGDFECGLPNSPRVAKNKLVS